MLQDGNKHNTLYIGTPLYNMQTLGNYTSALFKLGIYLGKNNIPYKLLMPSASSVSLGRNRICHEFVKDPDAEYLLFVDSDIGFDPLNVESLLDDMQLPSQYDVIALPYPHKAEDHFNYTGASSVKLGDPTPVEINRIGCGFMMIRKSTLTKMQSVLNTFRFEDEDLYQYFHNDILDGVYMSEDFWFCDKVKAAGMKVYMKPMWNLTHTGNYMWKSTFQPATIARA